MRGSAERLAPVAAAVGRGTSLPGWRVRILDGNHLPASEKRLALLREHHGAALPGQTLVVYDPDSGLITDVAACEDAHASERAAAAPLLDSAQHSPGRCGSLTATSARARSCRAGRRPAPASSCASTPVILGWPGTGTGKGVAAPRRARCASRRLRWQGHRRHGGASNSRWTCPRRPARARSGCGAICAEAVGAQHVAELYRSRWRIEGMFQRLESALHSEISSHRPLAIRLRSSRWRSHRRGHPRAALLGFAAAVLAYNVLALLQRCVEQAHGQMAPPPEVSLYHLALQIRGGYEGILIALPPEHWPSCCSANPTTLAGQLLRLARNINPRQVREQALGCRPLHIRQADVAATVGVSRQAFNKELRRIDRAGLAGLGHARIGVIDPDGLRAFAAALKA